MSHSEQDITVLQCWRILLCCWAAQQDAPALSGGLYWEILPWSGGCTGFPLPLTVCQGRYSLRTKRVGRKPGDYQLAAVLAGQTQGLDETLYISVDLNSKTSFLFTVQVACNPYLQLT